MRDCSSAYVHIPFCVRKCPYCDFVSFENQSEKKDHYLRALLCEIRSIAERSPGGALSTVYLGGGTPSLLTPAETGRILCELGKSFGIKPDAEITIEVNPGTVDAASLTGYRKVGFNRISIGTQSFSDSVLCGLERIHTAEEAKSAIDNAKEAGLDNISCDLMIGVPNQIGSDIENSLRFLIEKSVSHISCYSLSLEEGTRFFKKYSGHPELLPSDESEREMYHLVRRFLTDNGFVHYEISNFALPGRESRHNNVYWSALPYYGFGCGAHSYFDGRRAGNTADLERYIRVLSEPCPVLEKLLDESDEISLEEQMKEFMLLGFRRLSGISEGEFLLRFGIAPTQKFGYEFERLLSLGLILHEPDRWFLSEHGLDFGNEVFRSFV